MAKGDYLSPKQAAKFLSFTNETLILLDDIGQAPPMRRTGTRPYHKDDLRTYELSLPDDLNEFLEEGPEPVFALDDNGIWREIVTYSQARAVGYKRYFDGQPCRAGHIAEHFTKNFSCTICSEIRANRYRSIPAVKHLGIARILGIKMRER